MWVHAALGRIALEEFKDPSLARGHFGYAVVLVERAVGPKFNGRLPRERPANRPFYEALEGLITALEAIEIADEAARLRGWRDRLSRPRG